MTASPVRDAVSSSGDLQNSGYVTLLQIETRKSISADISNTQQLTVSYETATCEQQFCVDDDLKKLFENEMHAYHITSNISDASVVRLVLQV